MCSGQIEPLGGANGLGGLSSLLSGLGGGNALGGSQIGSPFGNQSANFSPSPLLNGLNGQNGQSQGCGCSCCQKAQGNQPPNQPPGQGQGCQKGKGQGKNKNQMQDFIKTLLSFIFKMLGMGDPFSQQAGGAGTQAQGSKAPGLV